MNTNVHGYVLFHAKGLSWLQFPCHILQAFQVLYPYEDHQPNATPATTAEEVSQCGIGHISGSWLCQWCEEHHTLWRGQCERCLGPPLLRFTLFWLTLILAPVGLTLVRFRLLLGDEMCSGRRMKEAMAQRRAIVMQSLQSLRKAASSTTKNMKRASADAANVSNGLMSRANNSIVGDLLHDVSFKKCSCSPKQLWRKFVAKLKSVSLNMRINRPACACIISKL